MKKKIALALATTMALSLMTGCGGGGTTADTGANTDAAEPIVLKLNHVQSNTDPVQAAFLDLADMVKERSNGSLEIQVYANSELGSNKDNLEQISSGASLISVGDAGFIADYVPDIGIMNGPFLYSSYDELVKLCDSDWYHSIEEKCSEQGIKLLAMDWYFGERHIISKKPISSTDDMKGLKIRVPSNTMWTATMEALGAAPTTIQWSEVYSALDQGVVDAAEAPLATIYSSKLQEAAKSISTTGHFTGIIGLQMSQKVWDSLSEEQQTVLAECIEEEGKIYSESVLSSEQEYREKLEAEGVTFIDVDRVPFQEMCQSVYSKFPEWSEGLLETVQAAMQ